MQKQTNWSTGCSQNEVTDILARTELYMKDKARVQAAMDFLIRDRLLYVAKDDLRREAAEREAIETEKREEVVTKKIQKEWAKTDYKSLSGSAEFFQNVCHFTLGALKPDKEAKENKLLEVTGADRPRNNDVVSYLEDYRIKDSVAFGLLTKASNCIVLKGAVAVLDERFNMPATLFWSYMGETFACYRLQSPLDIRPGALAAGVSIVYSNSPADCVLPPSKGAIWSVDPVAYAKKMGPKQRKLPLLPAELLKILNDLTQSSVHVRTQYMEMVLNNKSIVDN